MLAKTPLKDQMIAWLQTKDPKERYNWENICECACGQFASDMGYEDEWFDEFRVVFKFSDGKRGREWAHLNFEAYKVKTFGGLLKRLAK